MTKAKAPLKLVAFDAARYLDDDEAIAEYMTAVLEANDPDLLLLALSDVARAKGMAQVAKDAGLGRESLYKALAPGAKPRFETIMKVARALGVKFTAQPACSARTYAGCGPTPRFSRAPTAGKQARAGGTRYVFSSRGHGGRPSVPAWLERQGLPRRSRRISPE